MTNGATDLLTKIKSNCQWTFSGCIYWSKERNRNAYHSKNLYSLTLVVPCWPRLVVTYILLTIWLLATSSSILPGGDMFPYPSWAFPPKMKMVICARKLIWFTFSEHSKDLSHHYTKWLPRGSGYENDQLSYRLKITLALVYVHHSKTSLGSNKLRYSLNHDHTVFWLPNLNWGYFGLITLYFFLL